jgi:hypothetical protein
MGRALGTRNIASGDAIGKCRAETCQRTFQGTDEAGKYVVSTGRMLNAPDVVDALAIEQHWRRFWLTRRERPGQEDIHGSIVALSAESPQSARAEDGGKQVLRHAFFVAGNVRRPL